MQYKAHKQGIYKGAFRLGVKCECDAGICGGNGSAQRKQMGNVSNRTSDGSARAVGTRTSAQTAGTGV